MKNDAVVVVGAVDVGVDVAMPRLSEEAALWSSRKTSSVEEPACRGDEGRRNAEVAEEEEEERCGGAGGA